LVNNFDKCPVFNTKLREKLIINGKGDEIVVLPAEGTRFTNKKIPLIDEERMLHHLADAQEIYEQQEVGQREASVELHPANPDLPIYIWLNTDDHLGSIHTDYKAFLRDYTRVRELPNFYVINNGDEVDAFMINNKAAAGVYENPMSPQEQGFLFHKLFKQLDDQKKIIAFSFGNHNQWLRSSGYKFENTWLRDFNCPVLNCGGEIKLKVGKQEYKIGISHMHWGTSKINITNPGKRMLQNEHPDADVIFLGHCFSSDTEVLTENGWKTFDKVQIGEKVMTRNLDNGNSEWNPINKIFHYTHYKKLIHFKNQSADLLVTPEHAVVASSDYKKIAYKRIEANNFIGKKVYMPVGGINNNPDIKVSDDWLRLVAWIITEGSYSAESLGHIRISQSEKEKVGIKHIIDICDNLGLTYSCIKRYSAGTTVRGQHRNYDAYRINLHSCETTKKIVAMFPSKKFNSWFLNLSNRQFEILFKEMILADGNKNSMGHGFQYGTKWKDEADIIQSLYSINGYRTSVIKRERYGKFYYCITINPRTYTFFKEGGKLVDYSGDVWCVSVDNKTLFVRRNGKAIVCGNTHQKSVEHMNSGGKDRLIVMGGCYKTKDEFSPEHGMGGGGSEGGVTLALYPDKRRMIAYYTMEEAVDAFEDQLEIKKLHARKKNSNL